MGYLSQTEKRNEIHKDDDVGDSEGDARESVASVTPGASDNLNWIGDFTSKRNSTEAIQADDGDYGDGKV